MMSFAGTEALALAHRSDHLRLKAAQGAARMPAIAHAAAAELRDRTHSLNILGEWI
jgi:hypothetical protein